jgi:hypothetical protein
MNSETVFGMLDKLMHIGARQYEVTAGTYSMSTKHPLSGNSSIEGNLRESRFLVASTNEGNTTRVKEMEAALLKIEENVVHPVLGLLAVEGKEHGLNSMEGF